MLLAAEHDVDVVGVDLGAAQVAKATARAESAGLSERAVFRVGDAEHLPVDDHSFDAVVSECAFCTFPDKPTAAEVARVVRPGGRLGLTDVWPRPTGSTPTSPASPAASPASPMPARWPTTRTWPPPPACG